MNATTYDTYLRSSRRARNIDALHTALANEARADQARREALAAANLTAPATSR